MARKVRFTFPLVNGFHARPASVLEEAVRPFAAAVHFLNERSGQQASARSVLGLVGTNTHHQDPCVLVIDGADEEQAEQVLSNFLDHVLPGSDGPLSDATIAVEGEPCPLPRSLKAAGLSRFYRGAIACRGLGRGSVVVMKNSLRPDFLEKEIAAPVAVERARFESARLRLTDERQGQAAAARGAEAEVLKAHLSLLRDPAITEQIDRLIAAGQTAGSAVVETIAACSETLSQAESAYLRERVLDLQDIGRSLLEAIYGARVASSALVLRQPSIVVADTITPGQFLGLDRTLLRGLILGHAGSTSHTVVLARSFNIPTLTGVEGAPTLLRDDTPVIVDAQLGLVIPEPDEKVQRYYRRAEDELRHSRERICARIQEHTTSSDGRRIEIGANIATPEEAVGAFAQGAEGIGLFRTEMLFLDRNAAPSEAEQYEAYATVAKAADNRPVIIRTIDIGGDKPASYLKFPAENNPFLGYRGVRFYADHTSLLKDQLKAILRAAVHGPLKVMIPMVACLEEVRLCKRLLTEVSEELHAAHLPHIENIPFGIMLEVPSVAFILEELCTEVDFFSIGTNDLTQYFLAADRENPKVAELYSSFHPGFLRLLKQLVDGAHAGGKWIGLCGELGENATALPLLLGLGLDEISLAAPRIAATKLAVSKVQVADCVALLNQALRCSTRESVMKLLSDYRFQGDATSMLAPELVIVGSESETKEEVIREMVGALFSFGRAERPDLVEEAVWAREDTYSTGFGGGFAIPHCKTDEVSANSIVVLRLSKPVTWGSLDGEPVDIVILLAIRARDHGKEHMKTLARLSRLVMREEFRALLRSENDPQKIAAILQENINPSQGLTEN